MKKKGNGKKVRMVKRDMEVKMWRAGKEERETEL